MAVIDGDVEAGTPVAVGEENKLRILTTGKEGKLIIKESKGVSKNE